MRTSTAALAWVLWAVFVCWYEEPALIRQFGAEYQRYRRAVPAWWPRLSPRAPSQAELPKMPGSP